MSTMAFYLFGVLILLENRFPVLILWSAASRFIGQRQAALSVKPFSRVFLPYE